MKTTNIFSQTKNLFGALLFICAGTSLKAQISTPYPVTNGSCVDMAITYELVDPTCNLCDMGNVTIAPGVTIMLGNNCGVIQDVHIVLTDINSISTSSFPPIVVGDPDPCMNTGAAPSLNISAEAAACGSSCTPTFINYTPTGTSIF